MKVSKPKQFDPFEQMQMTLDEMSGTANAIRADLERLERLKAKAAEEIRSLRQAAEQFELLTEEQAAQRFGITADYFGKLRIRRNLPHVAIGRVIRYTPAQLIQIADIFSENNQTRAAGQRKAA